MIITNTQNNSFTQPISTYDGTSDTWSDAYTNLTANSANYLSGYDLTAVAASSANWDSTYTAVSNVSANWNTAYNYATTYPLLTSINYTPFNLLGLANSNTPLFTVPAGRKFVCTAFGANIIDVASTAPAGICTVRLINSTRGNSSLLATNFAPSVANLSAIDNTNIYGSTNSVAASGGETVSLRLVNVPTGFTTLSATMFFTGIIL